MAGDLSDPHGTHRVCAEAIFRAIAEHRSRPAAAGPKCCSIAARGRNGRRTRSRSPCRCRPATCCKKRNAIFMHQSRKRTRPCFPARDPREFWQRAEDRNTRHGRRLQQGRPAGVLRPGGLREVEWGVSLSNALNS